MWAFFILSMVAVIAAIFLLLRRFCANTVVLTVKMVTAYAWLTAMGVVAIVPLDVYSTLRKDDLPILAVMWNIAFWSTQALTWLLLPFFQYYSEAGDFTVRGKCMTSLRDNAILYGSVGAAGLVGVAILLITKRIGATALVGLGIGLSNAFGLIAGILLLGYGLVEIPRHLWKSNPEMQLKWCAHRAGKLAEQVMKSTAELETVVTIIHANEKQMRRHDPLRQYMDIITAQVDKDSPIKRAELEARNVDIEGLKAEDLEYNYDKRGLADLRRRLGYAIDNYKGDKAMYEQMMRSAFELEDIVKCRQLRDYTPRNANPTVWQKFLWQYKCAVRPHWHRIAAVILACTSFMIIWAESTIISPKDISPLSLLIKGSRNSALGTQILTLAPLAYICACSYAALFSITAFNYNKMVPGATTGAGLMQNGSLMCRFAAPTCWNFYYMIRMTSTEEGQKTVFTEQMGAFNVPAFLQSHLNTYLPLILVVECAITVFNLWEKILGLCVSSKYKFTSDDVDDEYTEKGRLLILKERETVGKGYAIGDVLHSAFFDLEFPTLAIGPRSRTKNGKKPGFFSNMFGKGKNTDDLATVSRSGPSASGASSSAQAGSSTRPKSSAAVAASRWLNRDATASAPPAVMDTTSSKASLLASRYDKSPNADSGDIASKGLDGIFADLASPGVTRSSGNGAAGGSTVGRLGTVAPVARETDSLLGGLWGRS